VLHIGTEFQYQVKDAAGNVVWQGAGVVGVDYLVKNSGASTIVAGTPAPYYPATGEAANTTDIPVETLVKVDGPNSTIGYAWNLGTSDAVAFDIRGNAVAGATDDAFLGVSSERIKAASVGRVAGMGSIMSVKITSGAIAVGAPIGGSATVGLGATMTTTVTTSRAAGVCVKASAQRGADGLYYAGILVLPF
jgi:hypothetical protein